MGLVIGLVPSTPDAQFVAAMVMGDTQRAHELCADDVVIDDPILGSLSGRDGVASLVAGLETRFRADELGVRFFGTVSVGDRTATEFEVERQRNGRRVVLPAAIVADLTDGLISAARLYYRRVSIDESRSYRRFPVLSVQRPDNSMHPTIATYIEALKHRDTEELVALFEPDGTFAMLRGHAELRVLFDRMFEARVHGVVLEHPNAFFDGTTTCIEFSSIRVPGEPGHAGVAFYEVGPSGLLSSARPLDE
jgi:hypothetical protein